MPTIAASVRDLSDETPVRNERFVAAARAFARRYNPLVLAYLRQHPATK